MQNKTHNKQNYRKVNRSDGHQPPRLRLINSRTTGHIQSQFIRACYFHNYENVKEMVKWTDFNQEKLSSMQYKYLFKL